MATSYACSYTIKYFPVKCSNREKNSNPNRQNLIKVNISGSTKEKVISQVALVSTASGVATTSVHENGYASEMQIRQNIPTEKQHVDRHRQGLMVENGVGYRQTMVVRSYEVGPDKTATLESLLNLLQETALNHVWMSGLLSNGFGATHGMATNNLIWVVSRIQVKIDKYPVWGEVVDIDTWVGASGKNGMRRDWLVRSQATGHVFARATSTWVMMNENTRRLSKMPEEVRNEISPWFIEKRAIVEQVPEKILKLDNNARHVISNLKPKRSDLDINNHVNNVKYVKWMLETIPEQFLQSQQLSCITLEYKRECGISDTVQSLCEPTENGFLENGLNQKNGIRLLNGFLGSLDLVPMSYTHLLQATGDSKMEEIVRGKTVWRKKIPPMPH